MSKPLFVRRAGLVTAKLPWNTLKTMIRRDELSRIHQVSEDCKTWVTAGYYPGLFDIVGDGQGGMGPRCPTNPEEEDPPPDSKDGSGKSGPKATPVLSWWYEEDGKEKGPVSLETLRGMLSDGSFPMDDLVWTKGMKDWAPARSIPELGDGPGSA